MHWEQSTSINITITSSQYRLILITVIGLSWSTTAEELTEWTTSLTHNTSCQHLQCRHTWQKSTNRLVFFTVAEKLNNSVKSALHLNMSAVKCLATDLYPDVANHCQRLLQAEWDGSISNKLIYSHVSGNILDRFLLWKSGCRIRWGLCFFAIGWSVMHQVSQPHHV